jgi:hypothetical protein
MMSLINGLTPFLDISFYTGENSRRLRFPSFSVVVPFLRAKAHGIRAGMRDVLGEVAQERVRSDFEP